MNTLSEKLTFILIAVLSVPACQTEKTIPEIRFLEIDVTKKYPVKELLLEDMADIWYILPDFHEDYLYTEIVLISDDYLMAYNRNNGDLLVFNSKGEPLHKFNKRGRGPGEYMFASTLVYDSNKNELFVRGFQNILVYTLTGEFKRSLPMPEHMSLYDFRDFNESTLLCYFNNDDYPKSFFLLSKEDGEVIEEIDINHNSKLDLKVVHSVNGRQIMFFGPQINIAEKDNGYFLTDYSIDTVYLYSKDKELTPVLRRNPSMESMEPYIYVNGYLDSPHYLFLQTVEAIHDIETRSGFPETDLMVEKNNGQPYEQRILLSEYEGKEITLGPFARNTVVGNTDGVLTLNVGELQDALEEGKLNGKLKEIASGMEEDSNNLLLFFRFKK